MDLQICEQTADLRAAPAPLDPGLAHQDLRLSQLLPFERITLLEKKGDWLYVEAPEQLRFSNHWEPYRGWIRADQAKPEVDQRPTHVVCSQAHRFPFGTYLHSPAEKYGTRPLDHIFDPEKLIQDAHLFLGRPYLWGGRSWDAPDCSGLISLLFRAQNRVLPRDAHDQFLYTKPTHKLSCGDLLFLAKEDKKRISHVMLCIDENSFLEAPETGKHVRFQKRGEDFSCINGEWIFIDRPGPHKVFAHKVLSS